MPTTWPNPAASHAHPRPRGRHRARELDEPATIELGREQLAAPPRPTPQSTPRARPTARPTPIPELAPASAEGDDGAWHQPSRPDGRVTPRQVVAIVAALVVALVLVGVVVSAAGGSSSSSDVTSTHTDDPHTSPDNASPAIAVEYQCGPVVNERDVGFAISRDGTAGEEIVWSDKSGNVWHALVTTYGAGWYDAQCKGLDSFP